MDSKKIILIADDDADLLQLIERHLQKAGFSVQLSPNGRGITEMVINNHPDLILLDIAMDGISGDDICKKLQTSRLLCFLPTKILNRL
jgi:DNA-binding response OmpR family regulator